MHAQYMHTYMMHVLHMHTAVYIVLDTVHSGYYSRAALTSDLFLKVCICAIPAAMHSSRVTGYYNSS